MHDFPLISTIAAGFTAAWVLGLATQWMRLSPIVGYLLAGVLIGPYTPGFIGDPHLAHQLAEVGVVLLMFGVGLHFHLSDLLAVKAVAIPGALGQSIGATLCAIWVFTSFFGMEFMTSAVIGMAMAVASTVVLMRVLMDADALNSPHGHVAVGWLLVEDVLTVIVLVLIPVLGTAAVPGANVAHGGPGGHGAHGVHAAQVAPGSDRHGGAQGAATGEAMGTSEVIAASAIAETAGASSTAGEPSATGGVWTAGVAWFSSPVGSVVLALLKLVALVAIILFAGSRVIPWVLMQVARLRSRELFTLTVLVFSIAVAAGSYVAFGASMALGAFLAGMVVAQSPVSHQAAADALPLRDAFTVLFFVSVGMLFDPLFLIREPLLMLAAMGIILIIKPLIALLIVAVLGYSVRTSLTVALGLAQIGEFSFILSDLARKHGLMTETGHFVLVGGAILSITLNPLLFRSIDSIEAWLKRYPRLWKLLNARAEHKAGRANDEVAAEISQHAAAGSRLAIVVGYGPVGRTVDRLLRDAGLATVVIDMNMDTVAEIRRDGRTAIFGDASREAILEMAGAEEATHLVLTLPQAKDRTAIVSIARSMNTKLKIFVRARYLREREELEHVGATAAIFEEAEASVALARLVLADTGAGRELIERAVRDIRMRLILDNVSGLRSLAVHNIMIPWTRVRRLHSAMSLDDVRRQVGEQHFSRWPVVQAETGAPIGYLLVKDLVSLYATEKPWPTLVRPLVAVRADDDIESTLLHFQRDGATMCIVKDGDSPVGIVTIEDLLEQVVGRIEDEYPRQARIELSDVVLTDTALLNLTSTTAEDAIVEIAARVPIDRLPPSANIAELAIARERELSTSVGFGVAIPHARCPYLEKPLVVFARSADGVLFNRQSPEHVHLIFLLITPAEHPETQVLLLSQLASLAGNAEKRAALMSAPTAIEVIELFGR